jgi:hypothetical protein
MNKTQTKRAECVHVEKERAKNQWSRFLQAYKNILHTWRWPCRPKHVVKDNENQRNKATQTET